MYCKYCGKFITDDSVFCNYCGKRQTAVPSGGAFDSELSELEGFFTSEARKKREMDAAMFDILDGVLSKFNMPTPAVSEVTLPDSVTVIDDGAFISCKGLKKVYLGGGVKRIGASAFYECFELREICVPDDSALQTIGDNAFGKCEALISFTVPNTVTSIGRGAFCECKSLKKLAFAKNSGLKRIGMAAFAYCNMLTGVFISDIRSWMDIEFENGSSNPLAYAKNMYLNGELLTDIIIPEGVEAVRKNAFYNYKSLNSVKLPDSLKLIGESAFYCCAELGEITVPSGVTDIGGRAFQGCRELKKVELAAESGLKYLGDGAFSNCCKIDGIYISDVSCWCNIKFGGALSTPFANRAKLYLNGRQVSDMVIPHGVTRIESNAFRYFTELKSISIPDSVTSIGEGAFYGCTGLTEVMVPNSVTSIESGAFYGCNNLKTISIPRGTVLGYNAFYGCIGSPTVRA